MPRMSLSRLVKVVALMSVCFVLSACDGDARPLTEAVEANDFDIASIEIQPPPGALLPLFVSPDEPIQFSILGRTFSGGSVVLSSEDRRWTSTNESVATINDNGVLVGRSNGSASINVRVAGAVAAAFDIFVSDAALQSIERIDGNNGDDTLSSCLPENFTAIGNFGGNEFRVIDDVVWTLDANSQMAGAEIFNNSSTPVGAISLVGRQATGGNVGDLVLTATLPADAETGQSQLSLSRSLEVSNTLTSLVIAPEAITVEVGNSERLVASATFSDRPDTVFVTNGAEWVVTLSPGVASVGDVSTSPGVVTGLSTGVASVSAICGTVSDSIDVTVEDSSGSLSFNNNGSLILNLQDGEFDDLRVSTGDEFDASRDVTDEAEWSSSDTSVVTVDTVGNDRGTLTLLTEGTSNISAEFDGTIITISVTVDNLGFGS